MDAFMFGVIAVDAMAIGAVVYVAIRKRALDKRWLAIKKQARKSDLGRMRNIVNMHSDPQVRAKYLAKIDGLEET